MNTATTPCRLRVFVAVLRKLASSAPSVAAAVAQKAPRRTGLPRPPSQAIHAANPPVAISAHSHADTVGVGCPPRGSAATRNSDSEPKSSAAEPQAAVRTVQCMTKARIISTKTSSLTSTGCTTDSRPTCSASAWRPSATTQAPCPASQSGRRTR